LIEAFGIVLINIRRNPMILELPDTLELTDIAAALAGLGLKIDGTVRVDKLHRTVAVQCAHSGCTSKADVRHQKAFFCSTHALARMRAAGY
jgi:hypothetical protein